MDYKKLAQKLWETAHEDDAIRVNITDRGEGNYVGINREWLLTNLGSYTGEDYDPEFLKYRLPRVYGAFRGYRDGVYVGAPEIYPSGFDDEIWEDYPKTAELLQRLAEIAMDCLEKLEKIAWEEWTNEEV